MRSPKLTTAVVAAAALLAPAGASAATARSHPHLNRGQRLNGALCRLSLSVAPRVITSGETTLASGELSCPGGTNSGQTVTVYERAAGSSGYSVAGTTISDTHGSYQLTTPALTRNTVFYASAGGGVSPRRIEKVAAVVTLEAEHKQGFQAIRTGHHNGVTFEGKVSPEDRGAEVILQRENAVRGTNWYRIGRTVVNGSGGFALTHIFTVPGESSIRVLVRSNRRNIASPSNELEFQISQAENPALTIESLTDPIAYGGSVVITGTVAAEPNTTVTLLGHTTKGRFAPLAQATTDSTGKYTFAAQSPQLSTFYRVKSANRSSTELYEGVKYILTTNAPPTTAVSGQALTFTGSVTPAEAGHPVHLERKNLTGTGFHFVAEGTVGANGEYTISRTFYAPGVDVLRVRVPGDPGNGGSAGPAFNLTVTPLSSASKLAPEPSGNSSLPPEGQV